MIRLRQTADLSLALLNGLEAETFALVVDADAAFGAVDAAHHLADQHIVRVFFGEVPAPGARGGTKLNQRLGGTGADLGAFAAERFEQDGHRLASGRPDLPKGEQDGRSFGDVRRLAVAVEQGRDGFPSGRTQLSQGSRQTLPFGGVRGLAERLRQHRHDRISQFALALIGETFPQDDHGWRSRTRCEPDAPADTFAAPRVGEPRRRTRAGTAWTVHTRRPSEAEPCSRDAGHPSMRPPEWEQESLSACRPRERAVQGQFVDAGERIPVADGFRSLGTECPGARVRA